MIAYRCDGPSIPPVGVDGVLTVKGLVLDITLMTPIELVADTITLYSPLGIKRCRVILVSAVYTVVVRPVPLVSWYVTL